MINSMPAIRDTPGRDRLERLRQEAKTVKIHTTLALAAVLGAIASYSSVELAEPVAKHTSTLSGQMWLEEILYGHPNWCHTQFGMSTEVFELFHIIKNTTKKVGTALFAPNLYKSIHYTNVLLKEAVNFH